MCFTCCLGHKRYANALCLVYEMHQRVNQPMNEYLNHFVATLNTRPSASLCELALVIWLCRTVQFSRSFLPLNVRVWNLLPSDVFMGSTLCSFKSAMNLCLLRA